MVVARLGQQSALETKAFEKLMPLSLRRERVFGMYLRSSLRMSSVRMKTMLGFVVSASTSLGSMPRIPKESSTAKATQATDRTIFLTLSPLLNGEEERKVTTDPCPCPL